MNRDYARHLRGPSRTPDNDPELRRLYNLYLEAHPESTIVQATGAPLPNGTHDNLTLITEAGAQISLTARSDYHVDAGDFVGLTPSQAIQRLHDLTDH